MPAISVISEMESNSSGQFSVETETEDGQTERVDFSNTEEIELDWDFPQELRSTPDLLNKYPYGFNNKTTDYFDDLEEVRIILLLVNIHSITIFTFIIRNLVKYWNYLQIQMLYHLKKENKLDK